MKFSLAPCAEILVAIADDAANDQQRTSVWGLRFRVSAARDAIEILPAAGGDNGDVVVAADSTTGPGPGEEAFDTDAPAEKKKKRQARL
jgi:hypothetical protein